MLTKPSTLVSNSGPLKMASSSAKEMRMATYHADFLEGRRCKLGELHGWEEA